MVLILIDLQELLQNRDVARKQLYLASNMLCVEETTFGLLGGGEIARIWRTALAQPPKPRILPVFLTWHKQHRGG